MSTLTKFTKSAALLTIGGAAMIGVPALASATPFTITEPGSCATAPSADASVVGGKLVWEIGGAPGTTTTGATVDFYQFPSATAPFTGGSGTLTPGAPKTGAPEGPLFTIHLLNGGIYDPDGTPGNVDDCTVGDGFAVTN